MSSDGPPWFAYDSDGQIVYGGVPERLLHHPEIRRRGIKLTNALKPVRLQHGRPYCSHCAKPLFRA